MVKILRNAFTLFSILLLFSGCAYKVKDTVYIKPTCPKIKVLDAVPTVSGSYDINGTISDEQLNEILKTAHLLRNSEKYYIKQVTEYNNKFASKPLDNK